MATATAVVTRRGNDQFRGLFSDTWAVTCTLDAGSLVDGAGETDDVTVPGVALGDMVIGASLGVTDLTVKGDIALLEAFISSMDTKSGPANAEALSQHINNAIVFFMAGW